MSKDSSNIKPQAIALAVVALVAGVLIGIVGASLYDINGNLNGDGEERVGISEEEVENRVGLNTSLLNHTHISIDLVRSLYDETGDEQAYIDELGDLRSRVSSGIRTHFNLTRSEQTQTNDAWGSYINNLVSYSNAATRVDTESMSEAENQLSSFPADLADILAGEEGAEDRSDELHQDIVDNLNLHIEQMLELVNAYIAGNYEEVQGLQLQLLDNTSRLHGLLTT